MVIKIKPAAVRHAGTTGPRRRRARRGFTLVELAISLFVFGMMALLLGTVLPTLTRGQASSRGYAQAALLGQHKIDQIRQGGFSKLTGSQLAASGLIDTNPDATPVTAPNPAGLPVGTNSYSFTVVDDLVDNGTEPGYFPAGSTGVLSLSPALGGQGGRAPTAAQALQVTVTVSWGVTGARSVWATHTIIAAYS